MIRGQSYDKQLYYSVAHRLINNTFLNGSNGIINNIGNACKITFSNNTISIADGILIIQGGLIEIVNFETLSVALDGSFCKLICEIDMSQINTEEEFNQGKFKILIGSNNYPNLIQEQLTESSGIFQYELAQFRALTTGIGDFIDKRTFIDYKSIFGYIQEQVKLIEDSTLFLTKESAATIYYPKENMKIIEGSISLTAGTEASPSISDTTINFPEGYTKDNCICVAIGKKYYAERGYSYGRVSTTSVAILTGMTDVGVQLGTSTDATKISIRANNITTARTLYYKIILMKIGEENG